MIFQTKITKYYAVIYENMAKNKVKICRVPTCGIELNENNCTKSFMIHGINICRRCNANENKKRLIKKRQEVIKKLGGVCVLCNDNRYEVLSIDHINGNGQEDRKSHKSWKKYLDSIIDMKEKEMHEKYRCLCYNCNYTLGFYGMTIAQLNTIVPDQSVLPVSNRGFKKTSLTKEEYYARERELENISRYKHKLEMIQAYGSKCVKCNESHPLLLILDHINNNGNLEECQSNGSEFQQYLKRLGYPGKGTQLQLLCHNCNAAKEYIDRRVDQSENVSNTKEIYVKQDYCLTKEQEKDLWNQTRDLYSQLKIYRTTHNVKTNRAKKTKS